MTPVLALYEEALRAGTDLVVRRLEDGRTAALPVARWCGQPDYVDHALLDRCTGPTLDVGCGPGRLVAELTRRGLPALGVDLAEVAVRLARSTGASVLRRSVFEPLPEEGAWSHVLLADDNIGIGGDPGRLLRRVRELLADSGTALVEVDPCDVDERLVVCIEDAAGRRSRAFRWSRMGTGATSEVAAAAGLRPLEAWTCAERAFVALAR